MTILLITIPSNEKALELLGARSKLHGERNHFLLQLIVQNE